MFKQLAIVLLSGGMDSCVTASIANVEYDLAVLHVNYGQRTERRELQAFNEIADYYNVQGEKRFVVDIPYLSKIGGSSLTDSNIEVDTSGIIDNDSLNTYVPFRNTHLLAIAVSWAEVTKAKRIFIGAVAQDNPGYPDCSNEYYTAFNNLVTIGTKTTDEIEVLTPIIDLKKSEIIKKGISLKAPLDLTWSCYKNSDIACGKCSSCLLRLEAFCEAGVEDHIKYVST